MDGVLKSDATISKLVRDMGAAYSVIDTVVDSHGELKWADLFKGLVMQTVECVLLIREYCGHGFGGVITSIS